MYAATLHPQHAPSVKAAYTHSLPELNMRCGGQTLYQDVGNLFPSWSDGGLVVNAEDSGGGDI